MTNEELQAHINAIMAAAHQGELEGRLGDAWVTIGSARGINFDSQYRIKPKPLEVWINVYADGQYGMPYETREWACGSRGETCKTTKFREVIE